MPTHMGKADASPQTRGERPSSLARKYSQFTAVLLTWVVFVFFAYDLRADRVDWVKLGLLVFAVPAVAVGISKYTHHLLARPLVRLRQGIQAVREGRLDPIQVSRTGDEIEFLGDSLNEMITALKASQNEVRQYHDLLEERIRQRTEALEEATQRAIAASRAKSEFLANISHELRTPMSGVLGMLDIVLDDQITPSQREQLETAKSCAHSLLALLNDLLDLSKIEAGKMLLESVSFDLRSLAGDCVKSVKAAAIQKGIELRVRVEGEAPDQVTGDPLRVRQITMNLLSNAVKFTSKGYVELAITSVRSGAGSSIEIVVEDTGVGIPEDKLASIFEEFTQADGSVSRRFGGTGLGLAITRKLVELHRGTMEVHSQTGKGSRFQVALPLSASGEAPAPAHGRAVEIQSQPMRARILVVEDNLVNQKVVQAMLKKLSFEVHITNNGREALEALERDSYDLVLMDVQMPEMDGITAAIEIRKQPRFSNLPIVAMTAHAMTGDRERCLQAGMNGYLSKPVSSAHLFEAIRQNLVHQEAPAIPQASPAMASQAQPPSPQPPVDKALASRLMDGNSHLMAGMSLLFLQLAPERLARLNSAVARMDVVQIQGQALKLSKAAERIAAVEVARCASEVAHAAPGQNYGAVQDLVAQLDAAIRRLESHVGSRQARVAELTSVY